MKQIDTTKRKKHDVYIQEGRTYSLRESLETFCENVTNVQTVSICMTTLTLFVSHKLFVSLSLPIPAAGVCQTYE